MKKARNVKMASLGVRIKAEDQLQACFRKHPAHEAFLKGAQSKMRKSPEFFIASMESLELPAEKQVLTALHEVWALKEKESPPPKEVLERVNRRFARGTLSSLAGGSSPGVAARRRFGSSPGGSEKFPL